MKIINLVEDTKGGNCLNEHGLSFYIETKKHKLLVDSGATDMFLHNADVLEVDYIRQTACELMKTKALFYTGHCTGQKAFAIMKEMMGEQLQEFHSGSELEIKYYEDQSCNVRRC